MQNSGSQSLDDLCDFCTKSRAVSVQGAKFIQLCGLVLLFPLPGKTASHLATMKAEMMVTHSGSESAKQEAQ